MFDMSQGEFADALEVTQGSISHYETGRRSVDKEFADKLVSLGKAHKIEIDYNMIYGFDSLKTA